MCGRSLVIGVFFAAAVSALGCTRQTPQTPQDIIFAGKTFYDPGKKAAFVAVSGTLTGPGIAYENNSTLVVCYADMKECLTYSVEQIGPTKSAAFSFPSVIRFYVGMNGRSSLRARRMPSTAVNLRSLLSEARAPRSGSQNLSTSHVQNA
jgi:hypothetical protein